MAEIHVRKGAGGEGGTLPTLRAAAQVARPGDVVIVHEGIYREALELTALNVTWRSAERHRAVLDGGYHWGLGTTRGLEAAPSMPVPGPGHLPTGADSERRNAMVTINAPGVVWEGFCIQNVAGEGIEVLEPNVTVRGCAFYAMYSTAIQCNDTAQRNTHHVTIEDCDIVWTSLRTFALGENEASGAIKFGNTGAGNVIRNVRLWLAGGEGFNIGKRTRATAAEPFVIEGCTSTTRTTPRSMRCKRSTSSSRGMWSSIMRTSTRLRKRAQRRVRAALRIKDEDSKSAPVNSRNVRFHGNLAVNARLLIEVGGDDITQYECAVHDNTLISGPYTLKGVSLIHGANQQGTEVDFRRNAIHWGRALPGAVGISDGPRTRCTFSGNAWSERPNASHQGDGDFYGPLELVNPDAPVTATGNAFCESWAEWQENGLRSLFNLDNYRPRPGSPLLRDGVTIGALGPDGPNPRRRLPLPLPRRPTRTRWTGPRSWRWPRPSVNRWPWSIWPLRRRPTR
jgi:hypothetical protein